MNFGKKCLNGLILENQAESDIFKVSSDTFLLLRCLLHNSELLVHCTKIILVLFQFALNTNEVEINLF